MMICNRVLVFPIALKRRLIHRISFFNSFNEIQKEDIKKSDSFDREKLDFSNTIAKPFLNIDKINLLKDFYETQSEITCTYNFVIDEDVAKDIVKNIMGNDNQKKIVMEGNPGLGLITLNLINSGVSQVVVFDHSNMWDISLAQICSNYPGRVIKKKGNMHKSVDFLLLSSLDCAQQYGVPFTIIGITTSFYFIRGLVINFTKYDMWRNEFQIFLVISSFVWDNIRQIARQRYLKFFTHCLFHLLFNAEEIARYPRAAFLPISADNREDMILIRVSPKPDSLERIDEEELHDYFVLLRIIGAKKSNYIIPTLEKWIPGCGPYLISKGISMTTQISDLSPEEGIVLYNFVKNCEGYPDFKVCTSQMFPR